ncbi:MAG TPA: prefoldin subunit alpha [Archaeoglobus profundus]|nr:prefoldin subunit alpha [Archaeoglobus profundus]
MEQQKEREKEIREKYLALQQLQAESEIIQRKIIELELAHSQLEKTIESLEFFNSVDGNIDALMNLGGGVFAYVNISNVKKLLVDVGAGVMIEKDVKEAIEFLKKKKENIEQAMAQLEQALQQVVEKAKSVQDELTKMIQEGKK